MQYASLFHHYTGVRHQHGFCYLHVPPRLFVILTRRHECAKVTRQMQSNALLRGLEGSRKSFP
jgi:hypothetical protein